MMKMYIQFVYGGMRQNDPNAALKAAIYVMPDFAGGSPAVLEEELAPLVEQRVVAMGTDDA